MIEDRQPRRGFRDNASEYQPSDDGGPERAWPTAGHRPPGYDAQGAPDGYAYEQSGEDESLPRRAAHADGDRDDADDLQYGPPSDRYSALAELAYDPDERDRGDVDGAAPPAGREQVEEDFGHPYRERFEAPQQEGSGHPYGKGFEESRQEGSGQPYRGGFEESRQDGPGQPYRGGFEEPPQADYGHPYREGSEASQQERFEAPRFEAPRFEGPQQERFDEPQRERFEEPHGERFDEAYREGFEAPHPRGFEEPVEQRQSFGEPGGPYAGGPDSDAPYRRGYGQDDQPTAVYGNAHEEQHEQGGVPWGPPPLPLPSAPAEAAAPTDVIDLTAPRVLPRTHRGEQRKRALVLAVAAAGVLLAGGAGFAIFGTGSSDPAVPAGAAPAEESSAEDPLFPSDAPTEDAAPPAPSTSASASHTVTPSARATTRNPSNPRPTTARPTSTATIKLPPVTRPPTPKPTTKPPTKPTTTPPTTPSTTPPTTSPSDPESTEP